MKTPALILACLLAATPALAQKGHAHGEGRLDAVLDKDRLELRLELPLDVAVGFERAPRNEKEKEAIAAAARQLGDPALFLPSAAAGCRAETPHVELPAFQAGRTEEHADIVANHAFRCSSPAALKLVDTSLFRHFKRLYRIEAQRVGPAWQGAARLTPKNPVLSW